MGNRNQRGQASRTASDRTHPVGIDASPPIITEDKLYKAGDRRTFVGKQSVRGLKVHHGV